MTTDKQDGGEVIRPSRTQLTVLRALAEGKGCYVVPATRRALFRRGWIARDQTSARKDKFVITLRGREAMALL